MEITVFSSNAEDSLQATLNFSQRSGLHRVTAQEHPYVRPGSRNIFPNGIAEAKPTNKVSFILN